MIAAYNYSLAEIEERLFCRVLRAKFPKKSDKSRAPEPRVHFALSLGTLTLLALRSKSLLALLEIRQVVRVRAPLCAVVRYSLYFLY